LGYVSEGKIKLLVGKEDIHVPAGTVVAVAKEILNNECLILDGSDDDLVNDLYSQLCMALKNNYDEKNSLQDESIKKYYDIPIMPATTDNETLLTSARVNSEVGQVKSEARVCGLAKSETCAAISTGRGRVKENRNYGPYGQYCDNGIACHSNSCGYGAQVDDIECNEGVACWSVNSIEGAATVRNVEHNGKGGNEGGTKSELSEFNFENTNLNDAELQQLKEVITKYKKLFTVSEPAKVSTHDVDTESHKPINQVPYRAGFNERKVIEEHVKKCLKKGNQRAHGLHLLCW